MVIKRDSGAPVVKPTTPPDSQWYGVCTAPDHNIAHNKEYRLWAWDNENLVIAEYGKVSSAKSEHWYYATNATRFLEKKSREKMNKKGARSYKEVKLATEDDIQKAQKFLGIQASSASGKKQTIVSTLDPQVQMLVEMLLEESGQHIRTYLAATIDEISFEQLRKAQAKIEEVAKAYLANDKSLVKELIVDYLNIIPTRLPLKPDMDEIAEAFVQQFAPKPVQVQNRALQVLVEPQEDRLHQMMTALASRKSKTAPLSNTDKVAQAYWSLGTRITPIPKGSPTYRSIAKYIKETLPGKHIEAMYQLEIPIERELFKSVFDNIGNVQSMFHGTRTANGLHILRTGLIIPKTHANGSRFGRGIYFADKAQRSYNYSSHSNRNAFNVLFINDAAFGKMYKSGNTMSTRQVQDKMRQGYNSVHGFGTYSGAGDEYIVYNVAQQTARAMILLS